MTFLVCNDRIQQQKLIAEYIQENKISYGGVSLSDLFNDEKATVSFSPISFEVESMYTPKIPLYLTKKKEMKKSNHYIYLSDGVISSRTLHWFYSGTSENKTGAFAETLSLVKKEYLWLKYEPTTLTSDSEESNFISIIRQETKELIYSNLLQFFFCSDKTVFRRFAKEFLKADICESYIIEREKYNIDLLITDEKNFIVIENKIEAELASHQLKKYFEIAEKNRNGRKRGLFVLSPNYNTIELKKFEKGEEYVELKYSQLYEFFSRKENHINSTYFSDFLFSLSLHAGTISDLNQAIMKQRLMRLIKNKTGEIGKC